jgi:hypothetical protein
MLPTIFFVTLSLILLSSRALGINEVMFVENDEVIFDWQNFYAGIFLFKSTGCSLIVLSAGLYIKKTAFNTPGLWE